jgi:type I restriction enzyme S subunit
MKNSGVEWIGNVPIDWTISKVGRIGKYINGYAFKPEDWGSDGLPIIRIQNLSNTNNEYNMHNGKSEDKYIISKGDYLISWSATLDIFKWQGEKAYLNQHIFKTIPYQDYVNYNYFYWLAKCFMLEMSNDKHGSAMQHVTKGIFNNFPIALPNKKEQFRIANFLDERVSKIDNIIATTTISIEEYKKYKQSLITEAVTIGLNSDVEMKDSGVNYINRIPVTWMIRKIKHIIKPLIKPITETDEVITCFRDGEVTLRRNRREEGFTFSDTEKGYQGVDVGDLVIHGLDAFAGAIGISDSRGKCTPVVHVCESKENLRFYMYFLRSLAFNNVFMALSDGIRIRSSDFRNWNKLSKILAVVPPTEEQNQIAEFLDKKCTEIDILIAQKEQLLIHLEQYKKSLIYECVTGKREV